jgi:hypothetical protein
MPACEKCGIEIQNDETYKVKNQELCEECMIKYQNPPKGCGGGPGGATKG